MTTITYPTDIKANKEHRCCFCGEMIRAGETYRKSTHEQDGSLYDWKTHKHCAELATRMKMYDDCDEGVSEEDFTESVREKYFDIVLSEFTKEEIEKHMDIIQHFRCVSFGQQLRYVRHHYAKLDKQP
jgi:hypothetical protein